MTYIPSGRRYAGPVAVTIAIKAIFGSLTSFFNLIRFATPSSTSLSPPSLISMAPHFPLPVWVEERHGGSLHGDGTGVVQRAVVAKKVHVSRNKNREERPHHHAGSERNAIREPRRFPTPPSSSTTARRAFQSSSNSLRC